MSPSRGTPQQSTHFAVCKTPEQISTPDEPPPSVHPALLVDDEFRSVHIAKQTKEFHAELCRRLENHIIESASKVANRKRKRGSDASEQSASTGSGEDGSSLRRSDTQDSWTTTSTRSTSSTSTAPTIGSKRTRFSDNTTPLSSVSPRSVHEDKKPIDLSWWQPLSPSPPSSPKLKAINTRIDCTGSAVITGYG